MNKHFNHRFANIIKIENIPENIDELWLGHNDITKIENIPSNVKELILYNNPC